MYILIFQVYIYMYIHKYVMSNKITLMQGRIIRRTDVVYHTYKAAARYAAPWFSFWHDSHHYETCRGNTAQETCARRTTATPGK